MAKGEFDVRLPVESRDEFGELARGFNDMAAHLQASYRTSRGASPRRRVRWPSRTAGSRPSTT